MNAGRLTELEELRSEYKDQRAGTGQEAWILARQLPDLLNCNISKLNFMCYPSVSSLYSVYLSVP